MHRLSNGGLFVPARLVLIGVLLDPEACPVYARRRSDPTNNRTSRFAVIQWWGNTRSESFMLCN